MCLAGAQKLLNPENFIVFKSKVEEIKKVGTLDFQFFIDPGC